MAVVPVCGPVVRGCEGVVGDANILLLKIRYEHIITVITKAT